jgi:hypothetical protein
MYATPWTGSPPSLSWHQRVALPLNKAEFQKALRSVEANIEEDYARLRRNNPMISRLDILNGMVLPNHIKKLLQRNYSQ